MGVGNSTPVYGLPGQAAGTAWSASAAPAAAEEAAVRKNEDRLDFSWAAWQKRQEETRLKANYELETSTTRFKPVKQRPRDVSGQLTARLVAASMPFEVRGVMSSAQSQLTSLLVTAAMSEGKDAQLARSYAGKLQKLIMRARVKIDKLNDEALRSADKKRAESNKQQKRAEEIKNELRQKRQKRALREGAWMRQSGVDANDPFHRDAHHPQDGVAETSEAQIAAYAEALAAYEAAMGLDAGGGGDAAAGAEAGAAGGEGGEGGEMAVVI